MEDGRILQIGSSCLADFFPNSSPASIAAYSELLYFVRDELEDLEEMPSSMSGDDECALIRISTVLALAAAEIRENGYMSVVQAEEYYPPLPSTSLIIKSQFSRNPLRKIIPIEQDIERAETVLEWLRTSDYVRSGNTTFMHNLLNFAESGHVNHKNIGVVAAGIIIYDRYLEKVNREKHGGKSEFIGKDGEKLSDYPVKIIGTRIVPGDEYGDKILYQFEDQKHNQLTWFCSGNPLLVEKDVLIHLSGTIDRHTEYKGVKQTQLKRCSVLEAKLVDSIEKDNSKAVKRLLKRSPNLESTHLVPYAPR
nr:hypothetical protein [Methylomarinum sp. Ch1-1]MDP4523315.1 hypothetical protein [Methylomarinum sp. Ch1-1]